MKMYQILYFFMGMAISYFNTYFFIGHVMGDMPSSVGHHIMNFVFAIFLGCITAYSATYYYKKKKKDEEILREYNASISKKK